MRCNCDTNCIGSKNNILHDLDNYYNPCDDCFTKKLKKSIPIKRQIKLDEFNDKSYKCPSCGKRHIDFVMAHILKFMISNDFLSQNSSIRKVGTPLITPAIPMEKSPFLSENSLVLIINDIDKKTANEIYENVPEVKAVIKGDINKTVGQKDDMSEIYHYDLLAGCDVRCDIQPTDLGNICIFKKQSEIHIEYPKVKSQKIIDIDEVLDKYDNPTVIDAMCGPGTLGIYAIMKNARKVLFNDIYQSAIDATKVNLDVNQISSNKYVVVNKSIQDLVKSLNEKYDVGFIDAFPGMETDELEQSLKKICDEVIII
ncbi:50S ribosomal protein L11 methyltransferase [Methanosphaera sp.]